MPIGINETMNLREKKIKRKSNQVLICDVKWKEIRNKDFKTYKK